MNNIREETPHDSAPPTRLGANRADHPSLWEIL